MSIKSSLCACLARTMINAHAFHDEIISFKREMNDIIFSMHKIHTLMHLSINWRLFDLAFCHYFEILLYGDARRPSRTVSWLDYRKINGPCIVMTLLLLMGDNIFILLVLISNRKNCRLTMQLVGAVINHETLIN